MTELVYKLENVAYSYGKYFALKNISFAVSAGESLAILGANGSGKSSLLKILNGLQFASAGRVEFFGERITEDTLKGGLLRCFRERVGFVFPEPDVQLFCPTVFEEVAFGPLQLDIPANEAKKRVQDLLDMLGISALKERAPHTLSSGEKKKSR